MDSATTEKYRMSVSRFAQFQTWFSHFVFSNTFGRLPYFRTHAPGIDILGDSGRLIGEILAREAAEKRAAGLPAPSFLDVGARRSERAGFAEGYDYHAMDIAPRAGTVLVGDICACPQIPDDSFDVVFSMDVFEHVREPWEAARECIRITKPGGLMIHRTLFAYRYHPSPVDYWRYSAQGLEYLFTRTGRATTVVKGYDLTRRRADHRGSHASNKPPIDHLGGFRENWRVLWIGRKSLDG
ncbi:class I SAM-dependent methyltransferase [Pinisolibacter sp. B13]|nr:class I SAM-dependent methyltransferase [Pinisolibacter aquiterrae]